MEQTYTVAQMVADITQTFTQASVYVVPAAILVSTVAFVLAWFMDSIDFAGRTFGRHR